MFPIQTHAPHIPCNLSRRSRASPHPTALPACRPVHAFLVHPRCESVPATECFRSKLMRHISLVICRGDPAHHPIPLHFLRVVQFMPSWYTPGVKVSQPLNVSLDCGDQITFHNLHVINIVQQPNIW